MTALLRFLAWLSEDLLSAPASHRPLAVDGSRGTGL
jgi:hypothetical protein